MTTLNYLTNSWNPLAEIMRLQDEMNNLFKIRSLVGMEYPAINLWSNEEKLVLSAPIPGISPDDIGLTVQGNELTIEGEIKPDANEKADFYRKERGAGKFVKSIKLPCQVKQDAVEAKYSNGILTVTMPRAEEAKPKKIKIQ